MKLRNSAAGNAANLKWINYESSLFWINLPTLRAILLSETRHLQALTKYELFDDSVKIWLAFVL